MKNKNSSSARNFLRATRGANMVEYIILVGLVALMCIVAYGTFGKKAAAKVEEQASKVEKI